jgi:hypothetical protein
MFSQLLDMFQESPALARHANRCRIKFCIDLYLQTLIPETFDPGTFLKKNPRNREQKIPFLWGDQLVQNILRVHHFLLVYLFIF